MMTDTPQHHSTGAVIPGLGNAGGHGWQKRTRQQLLMMTSMQPHWHCWGRWGYSVGAGRIYTAPWWRHHAVWSALAYPPGLQMSEWEKETDKVCEIKMNTVHNSGKIYNQLKGVLVATCHHFGGLLILPNDTTKPKSLIVTLSSLFPSRIVWRKHQASKSPQKHSGPLNVKKGQDETTHTYTDLYSFKNTLCGSLVSTGFQEYGQSCQ